MKIQSKDQFIIWSMALYFGWILSFPYYGAVLQAFAYRIDLYLVYLTPAFLFFHALGYLTGGLFLKKIARWRQLMLGSLILTLTTIAIMWFLPYERWPIALALIGFLSSFYVLGWSCLFSAYTSSEKIRLIAHFVIRANLIVMLIISLSFFLTARAMFVAATVPLIAAWIYFIIARPETVFALPPRLKTKRVFPGVNLLIICLFIIAVKITAGLMFSVIHVSYPVMAEHRLLQTYYNFIPYLLTFFGILLFIRKIKLDSMAFAGVLLLGLAFISFALLKNTIPGFIVTITIIEIAFALFSVWIWVLLGDLSFIYSAPYRFFGYGLFANLFGTLLGELFGSYLLRQGESPHFVTALYAAASIFIAVAIIPWLKDKTDESTIGFKRSSFHLADISDTMLEEYANKALLTTREKEIFELLLQGYANKIIANRLFISDNTLKSHLKKIYRKFGVLNKNELLAFVTGRKPS